MEDNLPQEVCDLTEHLRHAQSSLWPRLRVLFLGKGVDPTTSWLADCRTFQFGYDYLHKAIDEGFFDEWNDRTAVRVHLGANDNVEQIMKYLGSD